VITLVPITSENVFLFREVRLRALQEAPYAFGSTYARERAFTDAEWMARTDRWNGETGVGFLALEGSDACGIAGALVDPHDATRAELVSMWTAPTHRQRGVGRLLVEAVAGWATQRGCGTLVLMVTSNNESAMRFYDRVGFTRTGRTEPYPNDPAVIEYEMSRSLL